MHLAHINYLAVAVAALLSFGLGALWYSPILFGKVWQRELGFTDAYLQQGNIGLIFGSSLVLMVFMALGLALLMGDGPVSLLEGLHYGLLTGVLFVGASMGINFLYQRRSFRLWAIDAGYQMLFMLLMGLILAAWR